MIAVDWGTTNFRAYYFTDNQQVKLLENSNKGMMSIQSNQFETQMFDLFERHKFLYDLKGEVIGMSGMIGAKKGWYEVPYLAAPIDFDKLVFGLHTFNLSWQVPAFIVPGISITNKFGLFDVMRGEETQLLGLCILTDEEDLSVILPGTHSKHATIQGRRLTDFYTLMTGELFALLKQYSILTQGLPKNDDDDSAFLKGVEVGFSVPLSNALFSTRTEYLSQQLSPESVGSYLSGIIIGNEISYLSVKKTHYIIGNEKISTRYVNALTHLNYQSKAVDGESCFLQGINFIARQYQTGNKK